MTSEPDPFELLCKMQRTRSSEHAIIGACTSLLASCGLRNLPMPLAPLIAVLEIDFRLSDCYFQIGNGDASLLQIGNKFKILLHNENWRVRWRRTRFTVAHEIIHVLIIRLLRERSLVAALSSTNSRVQKLEALCQLGASELLMPTQHVVAYFVKRGVNSESLAAAYDDFLVSKHAMIRGLTKLFSGLQVIIWKRYARHQNENVEWRVADSFPYRREKKALWLPRGATLKHVCSTLAQKISSIDSDDVEFETAELTLGSNTVVIGGKLIRFDLDLIKERAMPTFENFNVADETYDRSERIMIFAEKSNPQLKRIIGSEASAGYESST